MYNLLDYGKMIADEGRTAAYLRALEMALQPGDTVLDLGCGPGLFALAACRFGAGRVIAVDTNPTVEIARQLVRNHGFETRIECVHGDAIDIDLTNQVDVVISDLRGVLPAAGLHLPTVCLARDRFLRPGGRLIPQRDTVWSAIVEAPELRAPFVRPFATDTYGFDFLPVREWSVHGWSRGRCSREALFAAPEILWETHYTAVDHPDCQGHRVFEAERSGTAHGIGVWFDTELFDGVGFTNAPWEEERVYGSAFFPWPEEVALDLGDQVEIDLRAVLAGEEYVWSWTTTVRRASGQVVRFQQSTLFGQPLAGLEPRV